MKLFKSANTASTANVNKTTNTVNRSNFTETKQNLNQKRILIVDDSRFSRNVLKDILISEKYEVVGEAGDGLEAIEMASKVNPDIIFMDVEMPKLDGIGAIPRILETDSRIHIIMCTALGQKKILVEAAKAGAVDYVIKPYNRENISGILSRISSQYSNQIQEDENDKDDTYDDSLKYDNEISQVDDTENGNDVSDNNEPQIVVEAIDSLKTMEPVETIDSMELVESVETVESMDSVELAEAVEASDSVEPLESIDSVEPLESIDSMEPEEAVEQIDSVEQIDFVESIDSVETTESTESIESFNSAASVESAEIMDATSIMETDSNVSCDISENENMQEAVSTSDQDEVEAESDSQYEQNVLPEEIQEDEKVSEIESFEEMIYESSEEPDDAIQSIIELEMTQEEEKDEISDLEPQITVNDSSTEDNNVIIDTNNEVEEGIEDTVLYNNETNEDLQVETEEFETEDPIDHETLDIASTSEKVDEITDSLDAYQYNSFLQKDESSESDVIDVYAVDIEDSEETETYRYNEARTDGVIDHTLKSDNQNFAYLWNDRFNSKQRSPLANNKSNQRVSFSRYINNRNDLDKLFGDDNIRKNMMLGMMSAYMPLGNRLQNNDFDDNKTTDIQTSSEIVRVSAGVLLNAFQYDKEISISDLLQDDDIKSKLSNCCNNSKSGLTIALQNLVYEKSNTSTGL